MIVNTLGNLYYDYSSNKLFKIGGLVVATDKTKYSGLYGHIYEIRDGNDKRFEESKDVEIYCDFDFPSLPLERKEFQKFCPDLKTNVQDSGFGFPKLRIPVSPEMIEAIPEEECVSILTKEQEIFFYVIQETEKTDGKTETYARVFASYDCAKSIFNTAMADSMTDGAIAKLRKKDNYISCSYDDMFSCSAGDNDSYEIKLVKIPIDRFYPVTRSRRIKDDSPVFE